MSENPLIGVSSLYGPGSIAGWCLTAISVLISWTIHPRKREKDSIDVNLIATLTLPCIAAGHLLWQTSAVPNDCLDPQGVPYAACDVRRSAAVIEAPFVVVQTSCAIYTALVIVGASKGCLRRAALADLVGGFCLAVERYMYLSASKRLRFLYVTAAPTRDLVSPRRWVVDETWETWNNAYRRIGACTIVAVCAGALDLGHLAPWIAIPFRNDIELSQADSGTQAIEARTDLGYVAGPVQNTPNANFLVVARQSGLKIQGKASKGHLRRCVIIAWLVSIAISLFSAASVVDPLLWYMHASARHEKNPPSPCWRRFTSSASIVLWNYFP